MVPPHASISDEGDHMDKTRLGHKMRNTHLLWFWLAPRSCSQIPPSPPASSTVSKEGGGEERGIEKRVSQHISLLPSQMLQFLSQRTCRPKDRQHSRRKTLEGVPNRRPPEGDHEQHPSLSTTHSAAAHPAGSVGSYRDAVHQNQQRSTKDCGLGPTHQYQPGTVLMGKPLGTSH